MEKLKVPPTNNKKKANTNTNRVRKAAEKKPKSSKQKRF
jgi:hypothetical protein